MKTINPYFKKYRLVVFLAILTIAVNVAASLYQPKLLQRIIEAIVSDKMDTVNSIGVQLIIIAVIGLIAGAFNTFFAAYVSQGVTASLRSDVYKKIQSFSFENIEKFSSSGLVVRMTNDIQQIQNLIMMIFQTLIRIPLLFIGAFILAFTTLPKLWWIIIVLVVLIGLISALVFSRMGKQFGIIQGLIEKINTIAKENLQGVRVVKSFNQQDNQQKTFNKTSDELSNVNIRIGYLFSLIFPVFMFLAQAAVALSIYWITRDGNLLSNPTDLSQVTAFINYLSLILFSLIMGGFMMTFASRGFISINRVGEVLKEEPALTYTNDKDENVTGSVSFKNVSFSYPNDDSKVLDDVSFDVKSGEMVGIVGATGSGKSTLATLIARLYDPTEGEILIGDRNIKDLSRKTLRSTVSLVLQKAILFSGTIADNLKHGKSNATTKDMQRAADIAQASEFVNSYDNKFDHEVEERSANFSGGQKQRLSIARGVIGDPKILILDDSTSALDAQSEKLVKEAIDKKLKKTTTFIIAEKISSVINANKILVFDEGKLDSIGTHKELIKSSKIYKEIYQTQKAKEKK